MNSTTPAWRTDQVWASNNISNTLELSDGDEGVRHTLDCPIWMENDGQNYPHLIQPEDMGNHRPCRFRGGCGPETAVPAS